MIVVMYHICFVLRNIVSHNEIINDVLFDVNTFFVTAYNTYSIQKYILIIKINEFTIAVKTEHYTLINNKKQKTIHYINEKFSALVTSQ